MTVTVTQNPNLFPWEEDRRDELRIERERCCELAERVFCVCLRSYRCPVHGQRCVGSHE